MSVWTESQPPGSGSPLWKGLQWSSHRPELVRPLGGESSRPSETAQRRDRVRKRWARVLCLWAAVGGVLIAGFGPAVASAGAATTPAVDLGRASTYAALSGASVGNTVSADGAPFTTLRGDLGVVANTQPTGFPPGVVTGTTQVGNTAAAQADTDLVAAYNEIAGRTGGSALAGGVRGGNST
jgi:hypothetical protein